MKFEFTVDRRGPFWRTTCESIPTANHVRGRWYYLFARERNHWVDRFGFTRKHAIDRTTKDVLRLRKLDGLARQHEVKVILDIEEEDC